MHAGWIVKGARLAPTLGATLIVLAVATAAADTVRVPLLEDGGMLAWREPLGDWAMADQVQVDPENPSRLTWTPGAREAVNGLSGNTRNILSRIEHGDVKAHIEFMVPKGSNSGVYFMGRYEIQVFDSWGVTHPQHSDCGGIYERWADNRGYEGRPPAVNASKRPGEWQTFDVEFRAPRFDENGVKTANAVFVRVLHNGVLIHENKEVTGPTRAATFETDEKPLGPLMLQGDHGPVAYRNITLYLPAADAPQVLVPDAIRNYQYGDPTAPFRLLEAALRSTSPDQRDLLERRMLRMLQADDVTLACKEKLARQLRLWGSDRAVPVLARLIQEDVALAPMALYALQGQSGAAATTAMRDSLADSAKEAQILIINELGLRRDRPSVAAIAQTAEGADADVIQAALIALGRIGGRPAISALRDMELDGPLAITRDQALLSAADASLAAGAEGQAVRIYSALFRDPSHPTIRVGALHGLILAGRPGVSAQLLEALQDPSPIVRASAASFIQEVRMAEDLWAMAPAMETLPVEIQVAGLAALERRGDPAFVSLAEWALESDAVETRVAGVRALGALGGADQVALLVDEAVADGPVADEARRSLTRISGPGVDEALLGQMRRGDEQTRRSVIAIARQRRMSVATPVLLDLAAIEALGADALAALADLAGPNDLPALLKILMETRTDQAIRSAEQAVIAVARQVEAADIAIRELFDSAQDASEDARAALARVLGDLQTDAALEALQDAARDGVDRVKTEAIRALGQWRDAKPLETLYGQAREAGVQAQRLLALRGTIRLIELADDLSPDQKMERLTDTMELAARPEEQRLILNAVAGLKTMQAFTFLRDRAGDAQLGAEARMALTRNARLVGELDKDAVVGALEALIAEHDDEAFQAEARKVIETLQ